MRCRVGARGTCWPDAGGQLYMRSSSFEDPREALRRRPGEALTVAYQPHS